MICVREGLPSLKLGASTSNILDIDVKIGSVSISVICVYFQPSTNVSLSALMRILCICKGTVIICGDFNAHNVMWGRITVTAVKTYCGRLSIRVAYVC